MCCVLGVEMSVVLEGLAVVSGSVHSDDEDGGALRRRQRDRLYPSLKGNNK